MANISLVFPRIDMEAEAIAFKQEFFDNGQQTINGSYNLNSAKNYNEANDFRLNLP